MKINLPLLLFLFTIFTGKAQSCDELLATVKESGYGTTYTSYDSDAISKVTFYDLSIDYETYYFAVVCFKEEYSLSCSEYLYQVSSNTKLNYSMNYMSSAGKAFWEYIEPYSDNLSCSPDFN